MNQVFSYLVMSLFAITQNAYSQAAEKSQAPVACTWEGVQQLCNDIEQADKAGAPYSFGEDGQLASLERLEKQSETFEEDRAALTSKQKKKMKAAFEKAINHSIETIRAGRTDEQLSKQEKSMIERIQVLQLSDLKSDNASFACKDKSYVGVFPAQKEMVVCPMLADYPEAALVQAIGTYVGHYVGTCVSSLPIQKSRFALLDKIEGVHPLSVVQSCLASGEIVPDPTNFTFDAKSTDPKDVATKAKIERHISRVAAFAPAIKAYSPQKLFDDAIKPYLACSSNITGAQMNSATNYWFGADVLARYMKAENKSHPKTRQEQLQPLAYVVDDACRFNKIKDIAADYGHASHEARFRDALLRNHRLRSALGCKPEDFKQPACSMNQKAASSDTSPVSPPSSGASGATQ